MSGLIALEEVMNHARKNHLTVVLLNVLPEIQGLLTKSGVEGDDITQCTAELQDAILTAQAMVGSNSAAVDTIDEESLGMVQQLLRETKSSSLLELAHWSANKERNTISARSGSSSNVDDSSSSKDGSDAGVQLLEPALTKGSGGDNNGVDSYYPLLTRDTYHDGEV